MFKTLYFVLFLVVCFESLLGFKLKKESYQQNIELWLNSIDKDLLQFNSMGTQLTWNMSTQPNEKYTIEALELGQVKNNWKNCVCDTKINRKWLTASQKRKLYLLCRGPKFTDKMIVKFFNILGDMSFEYNKKICHSLPLQNGTKSEKCVNGEPDLEHFLKRQDISPKELKWAWTLWHNSVGPRVKDLFFLSVEYQNSAAIRNNYSDIGEVWQEESEIPDLRGFVHELYVEISPLYDMLHAVIRHKLFLKYGSKEIDPNGPIPVHLLGNMWGQDWSPLLHLLFPNSKIDLNKKLKQKRGGLKNMVVEAEDFYISLGFPKMTDTFWKKSIFQKSDNLSFCHGSAANFFVNNDYRIIMCGENTMEDFYVIHHEMGHIEYYMAYSNQPTIFQNGVSAAFHESIGDAIMHGVMTPQHLNRVGLLTDADLLDKNTELYLLFMQALSKIPEIPFSLLLDQYRWDIFSGKNIYEHLNKVYWDMNKKYRGIVPPEKRREQFFDAGAKFHVADNTPYIRYFLSSILQIDLFKTICEYSVYGKNSKNTFEEEALPLHRCDIYGSKKAGKKLLKILEKGASITLQEALLNLTGRAEISTKPFIEYYKPVFEWLQEYIAKHNIYVGW